LPICAARGYRGMLVLLLVLVLLLLWLHKAAELRVLLLCGRRWRVGWSGRLLLLLLGGRGGRGLLGPGCVW